MSETEIQSAMPQASPILAYGTADQKSPKKKILAVIAGILVVVGVSLVAYARTPIRMPERILAIAAVRAQTELPQGSPGVWVDALHQASMPVLLGIAMTDDGPEPFVVTRKGHISSRFVTEDNGPFTFASEKSITKPTTWPLSRAAGLIGMALRAPAFLQINFSALDQNEPTVLEGVIDANGVWNTDTNVTASTAELPAGDFSLDIQAFPEAWPIIHEALRRSAFDFESADLPQSMAWKADFGTQPSLDLRFQDNVSSSTAVSFAAAAGIYDNIPYRLADGVVVEEFRKPIHRLENTNGTLEIASGTILTIEPHRLAIQSSNATSTSGTYAPCQAGGTTVVHLNDTAMAALNTNTHLLLPKLPGLTLSVQNGKLTACVK